MKEGDDASCDSENEPIGYSADATSPSVFDQAEHAFGAADGFESGYETDPVERFLLISRWQKQLAGLQKRLRRNPRRDQSGETPAGGRREKVTKTFQEIRERRQKLANKLREGQKRVVGKLSERRHVLQQTYSKQVDEIKVRMDKMLARARVAKMRQLRHIVCFTCSMADLAITSFWVGASPETLYYWFSLKSAWLIGLRAIWYRWHGWHYFLFDLCYFSNGLLLVYLWIVPWSENIFRAVYGFSGVLLISVPVFRNSFVPHSLDRMTSTTIHLMPALQLWVLRWYTPSWSSRFRVPEKQSVLPALGFYVLWLTVYVLHQFVFGRKFIEKKGYATLYQHMAEDMGIKQKLPVKWQGPIASRAVFVFGHFCLFAMGLPMVHVNFVLHSLLLAAAVLWSFKNGAAFYITYFWKVYENQILAFEKQMLQATKVATDEGAEAGAEDTDSGDEPGLPHINLGQAGSSMPLRSEQPNGTPTGSQAAGDDDDDDDDDDEQQVS